MKNDIKLICDSIEYTEDGKLLFAGVDCNEIVSKYGTPLYVMDENKIRNNCRIFLNSVKNAFKDKGAVLFASKACSFKKIYEIMDSEGLGIDVVSSGEIHTAEIANYPLEKAFFHSNNKTDDDIRYAIERKIGYFVCDCIEELYSINDIAKEYGIKQKILLRITPGIDCHSFDAVATGKIDSKFGSAIKTGQALQICELALSLDNIDLHGFHCHTGSEVFDSSVFIKSAEIMLDFIYEVKKKLSYETQILDLGGGFGVRYTSDDPLIDISLLLNEIANYIENKCKDLRINTPFIYFEPGRSIIADSGITLYSVGSVKKIPNIRNYVSVDGSMADNIRYALYDAKYTIVCANKINEECDFKTTVVGRCCESGDIIQKDVLLPSSIKRGDILVTLVTGAYNYSMASNYNRLCRPAVILIKDKKDYIAVKRESLEDLVKLDV